MVVTKIAIKEEIVNVVLMLKNKIYGTLMILLTAFFAVSVFSLIIYSSTLPTTRVYDCGMAEWHPDIPAKVKEECRKQRSKVIV